VNGGAYLEDLSPVVIVAVPSKIHKERMVADTL
jgi:hypothetical protein